jgi:hypothetical protein
MPRIRGFVLVCVTLVGIFVPATAHASAIIDLGTLAPGNPIAFSGTLNADNDFVEFLFTVPDGLSQSAFSAKTTSYPDAFAPQPGPGEPDPNGFDPVLTLFGSDGHIVNIPQPDGSEIPAFVDDADPEAGIYNSLIQIPALASGRYTLVVTQYFNYPHDPLGTGFDFDPFIDENGQLVDNAHYTCEVTGAEPCQGFADFYTGETRQAQFSGSIGITSEQPVPEPGTLALLTTGVGWLASRRRLRHKAARVQARDS